MARKKIKRGKASSRQEISSLLEGGLSFQQKGDLAGAEQCYRSFLRKEPNHPEGLHLLGQVLMQGGDVVSAEKFLRAAVAARPEESLFHFSLGNCFLSREACREAIEEYRQVIATRPGYADAWSNLAIACHHLNQNDQAVEFFLHALELNPKHFEAWDNLGIVLLERQDVEEALHAHHQALTLQPDFPSAHYNISEPLSILGRNCEAISHLKKALARAPKYLEAHNNLGNNLLHVGETGLALDHFHRMLEIDARQSLAVHKVRESLALEGKKSLRLAYPSGLSVHGETPSYHSNLLHSLHYHLALNEADIYQAHCLWERRQMAEMPTVKCSLSAFGPEKMLRIGYVSPDFNFHSVAFFFEDLLRWHDRENFEIFLYDSKPDPDAVAMRLRQYGGTWRDISCLCDEKACSIIHNDKIDILIDLAGHSRGNRLPLFVRRPAPVQMTYLGYPGTTGLSSIDYRITDDLLDPSPQADACHSEKLVRLPPGSFCYRPYDDAPDIQRPPSLETGQVTFANFNNLAKTSMAVFALWAQVLQSVPCSQMLIQAKPLAEEETAEQIRKAFAAFGVDPGRLILRPASGFLDHLALHNEVDLVLDTFPWAGHTTTCHALWMGVPVVTLNLPEYGTQARLGKAVLTRAGYPQWVAHTPEEYVDIAVGLAGNLGELTSIRLSLRNRLQNSVVMDAQRVCRSLENAFRIVWRQKCAGEL